MNPTLKLLIDEIRIRSTAQENAINLIVRLLVAKGLFERQEIDQATRIALQHLEASDEEESFQNESGDPLSIRSQPRRRKAEARATKVSRQV